ncbi:MAG TPA: DUF1573 domain-containing protein [Ignavibacteria bacterium]|nr:DUF1573 domain-containing protein [Ignavibacteria bacterium]
MKTGKTGKAIFFVTGLALVILFSAFLVNKNLHDPKFVPPVITFTQEKISLGDVKQGPVVNGEFEFTNTGKSVLIIKAVKPSCGCTGVIADEKKEFQPGETGKIKFTFATEGRSGMNEKNIAVESNDPKNPTKSISFNCNIVAGN